MLLILIAGGAVLLAQDNMQVDINKEIEQLEQDIHTHRLEESNLMSALKSICLVNLLIMQSR